MSENAPGSSSRLLPELSDSVPSADSPWKTRLEFWAKSVAIAYGVMLAIGGVSLFMYCFRNRFNPGGISVSDSLTLCFLAFAYLLVAAGLLAIGTLAAAPLTWSYVWISEIWRGLRLRSESMPPVPRGWPSRLSWRPTSKAYLYLGCMVLIVLTFSAIVGPVQLRIVYGVMILCGTVPSLIYVEAKPFYSVYPKAVLSTQDSPVFGAAFKRLSKKGQRWVVLSLLTIVGTLFWSSYLQDMSLWAFGFREERVTIRLSKEDFELMQAGASASGLSLDGCRAAPPNTYILHGVDIVLHKLGTHALVRYPSKNFLMDDALGSQIEIEIANPSFAVMRLRGKQPLCSQKQVG